MPGSCAASELPHPLTGRCPPAQAEASGDRRGGQLVGALGSAQLGSCAAQRCKG